MDFGMLLGAIGAGFICGEFPYQMATNRGNSGLAWAAMVWCIIAGFIGGILFAIPSAIVWCIVIGLTTSAPVTSPAPQPAVTSTAESVRATENITVTPNVSSGVQVN